MRIVALPLTFLFTTLVIAQAPGARRQARVYGDEGLGVWGQSWERVANAWGN